MMFIWSNVLALIKSKEALMAQVSNELTIKIRAKGWSLWQFLSHIDRSLSWYRTHAKKESHKYKWLLNKIDELEVKGE